MEESKVQDVKEKEMGESVLMDYETMNREYP